jgi:hypothetical protein
MKLFKCATCGQLIYFENTWCEKCGSPLGFVSENLQLVSLSLDKNGKYRSNEKRSAVRYRYCANYEQGVCNWLVPDDQDSVFCKACELNHTIPNLSQPEHVQRWKVLEVAKHRLVYSLLRMKLPLVSKTADEERGLYFDFVSDEDKEGNEKIFTGHNQGLITINIAEADDIEREMARKSMHEIYRTVLGHFRHEIAHYYWDQLINGTPYQEGFRALFGDEGIDYKEALKKHYEQGAPPDWNTRYISAYASTHPWEDWAETWAHYMHIVDTLETAYSFGLSIDPRGMRTAASLSAEIKADPYQVKDIETILQLWLPLTFAMNSLNRSMGLPDLYPFVIAPAVLEKMKFIHGVVASYQSGSNHPLHINRYT